MKQAFLIVLMVGSFFFSTVEANSFPIDEVEEMITRDDEARLRMIYTADSAAKIDIAKEIRLREINNTQRIIEILGVYGLPSDEETLSDISQMAIRSSDLDFQKKFLVMLINNDKRNEWIPELTDRILLREGHPQRYGTHLYHKDDSLVPYPIENLESMDQLRIEFDDLPLQTYIKLMQRFSLLVGKEDRQNLYDLFFLISNDFYDSTENCLYSVSFDPGKELGYGETTRVAFSHPCYAALYALISRGWSYKIEEEGHDFVICISVPLFEIFNLVDSPLYLSLVSREGFQPYRNNEFHFEFYVSNEINIDSSVKIVCESVLDPLLTFGNKIRFLYPFSIQYETERSIDPFLSSFFFDTTLENENFY